MDISITYNNNTCNISIHDSNILSLINESDNLYLFFKNSIELGIYIQSLSIPIRNGFQNITRPINL